MRTDQVWRMFIALILAALVLVACSSQATAPTAPPVVTTALPQETKIGLVSEASPTIEVESEQPTTTPATKAPAVSSEIKAYHTVLMLQRSADLTMTLIQRMQAGEIKAGDLDTISVYNIAFLLAGASFNDAHPPAEYGEVWKRAYAIIQQYNTIYTWLIEGKTISKENLELLRESRKFLTLDQELMEKFLTPRLGEDFIVEHQKAVEQHLEQAYRGQSVPSIIP